MDNTLPRVRLKPKVDAQKFRFGFPWVYADELVLDRRTRKMTPGQLAVLEAPGQSEPLGLATINPNSKLAARILDRSCDASIDEDWIEQKIKIALALRDRLFETPFYRLVHAEGDGLPGVIIDRFGDTMVLQANAVWADQRKKEFAKVLASLKGVSHVILNGTGRSRSDEGLSMTREALFGSMPKTPIPVHMNDAVYFADLAEGQKTGLFYDQRPNHAFAARFASGASVLDVFSHVGGFGLASLAAGALDVTCIDASEAALQLVQKGAEQTKGDGTCRTVKGDAFKAMEEMVQTGQTFDVVICDPPAFAPSRKALGQGLRAYERAARLSAQLVAPGGILGLCSCSHAATIEKFRGACRRGIGKANRTGQLIHSGTAGPDHPLHLSLADGGYLKSLFFRVS